MKIFEQCPICKQQIESVHMENHHYIPESLGGTLDHTIRVCGTCHDTIHYFIPINEISFYKTPNDLLTNSQIKRYSQWIQNRNNTGHIKIKKVIRELKVAS